MIEVKIEATVKLGDIWCDKLTWDEIFEGDLNGFIALLQEDWSSFIEEAGGLESLIKSAKWIGRNEAENAPEPNLAPLNGV